MLIHLNSSLKVNCEIYNAPEGLCILQKDAATHVILKAVVYTFREVTLSVSFDSFQNKGQLLKERIFSCRRKFFLLRVYPFFERVPSFEKANRNSRKLLPVIKM